jgi:hypothetical protein
MSKTQWAAVLFMLAAFLIAIIGSISESFIYTRTHLLSFLPWINTEIVINLMPNLISTLIAVILHTIIILRRGTLRFNNLYEYIILFLNILVCATFISVLVSNTARILIFGNIGFNPQTLIIFTIIFTVTSMKSVAGLGWIILFTLSLTRISQVSVAMGIWGAIYILCVYASVILQAKNSKGIKFLDNLKNDFFAGGKKISESVDETGKSIEGSVSKVARLL